MSVDAKILVENYSNQARIAGPNDKVYKDECVYTFDTPESPNGLFVCLNTFIGLSKDLIPVHFSKTQSHLYLHIKTWRREVIKHDDDSSSGEPEKKKPSKLGIGVEGGFDLTDKQFYFEHDYSVYIYPENIEINLNPDSSNLSDNVKKSVNSIINAESITLKEELASQAASWDGETRFVSKHSANLLQLPNPPQISPDQTQWKCEICGLKNNLWLNLTDGKILCGRRQLDGSGGNNHAIEHYSANKYPLSVKLGTITAKGADVYSYDEDDMVEDSNLAVHLAHFGINMSKMEKTEKTMAELEIDLNQKVGEWDRIQESGSKLMPLYGPGYTGMRNLGNSCYMNSVMQILFTVPDFIHKYAERPQTYLSSLPVDPSSDFNLQMSKLASGLLSGRYSFDTSDETGQGFLKAPKGIKPTSFKSLVGRGHGEFSTKRQQDAHEFLLHIFELIERNSRRDVSENSNINPVDAFKFQLEDRIECSETHQVRYVRRDEVCLSLQIPKSLAVNKKELEEFERRKSELESKGEKLQPGDLVRPAIRLEDCLKYFTQNEIISDFYSSSAKSKVNAVKSTSIATFPDYLLIQARKFELAADWTPVKLDVSLQVPQIVDLGEFKSSGIRQGETELPEDSELEEQVQINEGIVGQLMDMGFSLEGSQRAAYNTREANDPEAAVNWAMVHMEDADFNHPFQIPSSKPKVKAPASSEKRKFDEESINSITSFGFNRNQAIKALEATNGNLERAADWIFNHADEVMDVSETVPVQHQEGSSVSHSFRDGGSAYQLVGLISHMGTNANVGHYVAHILKDGKWAIFNDENVARSENPPIDLAYLYLYKRI